MTFEEWMLIKDKSYVPTDDSMSLRLLRECWFRRDAEIAELVAAIEGVSEKLKRAGASIPAPENKGTIESAITTGLSIALLLVDEAITKAKKP